MPHRIMQALQALLLGALVLWYGTLPVYLMEDAEASWQLRGTSTLLLPTALAIIVLTGLMAARLFKRPWLGVILAAMTYLLMEACRQALWRSEEPMTLALGVMFSVWAGLATLTALGWRRWLARLLCGLAREPPAAL